MTFVVSKLNLFRVNSSAPFVTMTFPVANDTFLRQIRDANQQIYNTFAVIVIAAGKKMQFTLTLIERKIETVAPFESPTVLTSNT